jgi:hypothetical protein
VFFREAPTILVNTPAGLTMNFDNTSGDFPSITTAANLNDPNLGWQFAGGRLNIQNEKRVTSTKGTHWDLKIGESNDNYIKVGVAYDDVSRSIQALDNSGRWQAFTCGGGLDANGNVPTPAPSCNGQAGSAITQGQLASFLRPGPLGFITVDYDAFKAASQFDRFNDSAPAVASAATAASSGFIGEKTTGGWTFRPATSCPGRTRRWSPSTPSTSPAPPSGKPLNIRTPPSPSTIRVRPISSASAVSSRT